MTTTQWPNEKWLSPNRRRRPCRSTEAWLTAPFLTLVNCRRVQKFRSDYNDLRKSFEQTKLMTENLVGDRIHLSALLPCEQPFLSMPKLNVLPFSIPQRLLCHHIPRHGTDSSPVYRRQFRNRHSTSHLSLLLESNRPSMSIPFSKRLRHSWITSLPKEWRFGIISRIRKKF